MLYTSEDEIAAALHTYTDEAGGIDLHFLRLRDRSAG